MPRGTGAIVSSAAGLVGVPGAACYTACKHAVVGLTRAAADYTDRGIRINCVAPSHVNTPMLRAALGVGPGPERAEREMIQTVPARRLGSAEDVANAVSYLVADQTAYVVGAVLSVDGGYVAV